ncbi:MAG: hypothetical protein IKC75_04335 [Clostridia bacterium]|nr:hypothetical protein [Clostridia bacterium]
MKEYPFVNPADRFRGMDLYMVNDKLEDGEIEKQIFEFREKGLYSVIFRTYNGLISDYPGEGFKHSVRVAVEAAKKCGLKIVLQAGFMPSAYPALPREYALHRIVPVKVAKLTGEERVLSTYGDTAFTDVVAPATVNMLDSRSVDYYIHTAYEEMWAGFTDDFGKTVIAVWLDEPRFDNRYLTWSPDLDEKFAVKYGYSIKDHISSLYFEVGDYKKVRYDYFTYLRDTMEGNYYTKVRDWCHAHGLSFAGHLMGEEQLVMQIAQAAGCMSFFKYFDVPGVDMLRSACDWYDKPQLAYEKERRRYIERSLHMSAIQCSSAAEQAGKKLKLCEMYGVTSPGFNFRDQMHLFDFFAANGINHQCMHALFYSPRGFRKRFYPQTFNRYQPFWENFRNVKDYVARVSSFISTGECANDIAILHPLETAYGLFSGLVDPNNENGRQTVRDYDEAYYRLVVQLYGAQIPFHFADLSTLNVMGTAQKNGRFTVGRMSYGTLVLADNEVLSTKALAMIEDFARSGGRLYVKGAFPTRLDGREDAILAERIAALPNVERFATNEELIRALKVCAQQQFEYRCDTDLSETVINHREDGEAHYFFVHNGNCRREKKGELVLPGAHRAYCFDAERGKILPLATYGENGKTVIPFTNPIGGATLVFTEPTDEVLPTARAVAKPTTLVPLAASRCEVKGDNVMTLEICSYKTEEMNEFYPKEMPIERVVEKLKRAEYEGNITLRFRFTTTFAPKGLKLVLEDAEECRVSYNGTPVDTKTEASYYSPAFRVVELPDVAKTGENVIEISRYTKPQIALPPSDDMKHLFELFRAPVGVDLERVHLLGDFLVEGACEYPTTAGIIRFGKQFFMAPRTGEPTPSADIASRGYLFYPGAVEYTAGLSLDENMLQGKNVTLHVGTFNGCTSAVFLNGERVGYIDRDPYALILPKDKLKTGAENEIKIRLIGTFRNMFGPSHMLDFDPTGCSRTTWHYDFENSECTEYDTEFTTNSFQLVPLGLGDLTVELQEN